MPTSPASSEIPVWDYYQAKYRLANHAQPKQQKTVAQYETDLRILNQAFQFRLCERGERLRMVTLADLDDELLQYAMKWQLDRGRVAATANRLFRTVKAVWNLAFEQGLVAAPPRTKRYREADRVPRAWTLDEFSDIMAAAEAAPGWVGEVLARDFFAAYFWFTYATGARQGVTLALPTSGFNPRRGEVTLPAELQKQNADQVMGLLPEAASAIAKLRSAERGLERLFGDFDGSITHFNKRLRKIIVASGLRATPKDVTRRELSHMVRRTFATHVTANSDEETARKLLGHSHISVTRKYLDPTIIGGPSARDLVPPLRPLGDGPPPSPSPPDPPTSPPSGKPTLRIHRPDDDESPRRTA
jgi:integrase